MSTALRDQIISQLTGENAHLSLERALDGLSYKDAGIRPDSLPYSVWEQAEHIRIAQDDIIQFTTDPDYTSPEWPEGYWPTDANPENSARWRETKEAITEGIQKMVDLVQDPSNDLLKPIPHGEGQTLFREAMLVVDHNAYHTGQIVTIRRALGLW